LKRAERSTFQILPRQPGGNLYDTGLAAALLIYGGVLERHPNLRVVLYHAGERCPRWSDDSTWDIGSSGMRNAIPVRRPLTSAVLFRHHAHNREMLGGP